MLKYQQCHNPLNPENFWKRMFQYKIYNQNELPNFKKIDLSVITNPEIKVMLLREQQKIAYYDQEYKKINPEKSVNTSQTVKNSKSNQRQCFNMEAPKQNLQIDQLVKVRSVKRSVTKQLLLNTPKNNQKTYNDVDFQIKDMLHNQLKKGHKIDKISKTLRVDYLDNGIKFRVKQIKQVVD